MSWSSNGKVGFYRLLHIPSGKFYVGSTADFDSRRDVHLSVLRKGKHHNSLLQALYNENPNVEFEFSPCESRELAYDLEQDWLNKESDSENLLNVSRDARKHTAKETLSQTHRTNISNANKGHTFTGDAIRRMSLAAIGRKASDETKHRQSESLRKVVKSDEWKEKARKALVESKGLKLNIDDQKFDSLAEASKALQLDHRYIMRRVDSTDPEFNKWYRIKEINDMDSIRREDDGITHINCWSRGKTELGQSLSNFAHTPFKHPEHGFFASMEAYWYWCASGRSHDHLRRLYGVSAKNAGTICDPVPMVEEEFHEMIREGLRCKIGQNPALMKALKASTLPLEHYFVYGKAADVVVGREKHRWQMECLEWIRDGLKNGITGFIEVGSAHFKSDVTPVKLEHACFRADSNILMKDGTVKPASEVNVGDELLVDRKREPWEDW